MWWTTYNNPGWDWTHEVDLRGDSQLPYTHFGDDFVPDSGQTAVEAGVSEPDGSGAGDWKEPTGYSGESHDVTAPVCGGCMREFDPAPEPIKPVDEPRSPGWLDFFTGEW